MVETSNNKYDTLQEAAIMGGIYFIEEEVDCQRDGPDSLESFWESSGALISIRLDKHTMDG